MPRPRRSSCDRPRVSPPDGIASSGSAPVQALRGRTPDGVRPDGGPAPTDLARPADLLGGRDLVGRLRDRGRHGRPGRSLARRPAVDAAHRDCRVRVDGDRRRLLPTDGARVRPVWRRVHRRQGEPGQAAVARCRCGAARRLRADRRRLGRERHLCDHVRRFVAGPVPRRTLARSNRRDRDGQPPRRPRGGLSFRDPDLRLHRCAVHHDRHGHRALRDGNLPARDRPESAHRRRRRRGRARAPPGLLIRRLGFDGCRGDRQRRECVPSTAVGERRPHARGARHDRDQPLPRRFLARRAHARAAELHRLGALADRARRLPGGRRLVVPLLGRAGVHLRDSRARPRTRRIRASRASRRCSQRTGSSRSSSRTSAIASSSPMGSWS